jgi:hypothetical protein
MHFISTDDLLSTIKVAIDRRSPFSFIRFGHCETRLVGFERRFDRAAVMHSIHMQWGKVEPPDAHLREVSVGILGALLEADVLALNDRDRPNAQPALLELEAHGHDLARELALLDGRPIARANVHWALGRSPRFRDMLRQQERVILVTGRNVAAARVAAWLDGPEVVNVLTPGDARHHFGHGATDPHYPEGLARLLGEIHDARVAGTVVLVGAGLLGKIVAGEARRAGGIAVDVGSLFDAWCGLRTRTSMPNDLELPEPVAG